jgi:hypothetical protein
MQYMSNDAQKVQDAMSAIHTIWGSPIYIIAILVGALTGTKGCVALHAGSVSRASTALHHL